MGTGNHVRHYRTSSGHHHGRHVHLFQINFNAANENAPMSIAHVHILESYHVGRRNSDFGRKLPTNFINFE